MTTESFNAKDFADAMHGSELAGYPAGAQSTTVSFTSGVTATSAPADRVSLHGVDPQDALRAMLRTPRKPDA